MNNHMKLINAFLFIEDIYMYIYIYIENNNSNNNKKETNKQTSKQKIIKYMGSMYCRKIGHMFSSSRDCILSSDNEKGSQFYSFNFSFNGS